MHDGGLDGGGSSSDEDRWEEHAARLDSRDYGDSTWAGENMPMSVSLHGGRRAVETRRRR